MLKKYLQIIIFSILCVTGITHDASGSGAPTPECCDPCIQKHGGNAASYLSCLKKNCNAGTVCPTGGIKPSVTGCCADCITKNLGNNGEVNFDSGSAYGQCIITCNDICPAKDTSTDIYQHLLSQHKS